MSSSRIYEIGDLSIGFSNSPLCDELLEFYPDMSKSGSNPNLVVDSKLLPEFKEELDSSVRGSDNVALTDSAIYIDETNPPSNNPKGRLKKSLGLVGYAVRIEGIYDDSVKITIYHGSNLFVSDHQALRTFLQLKDRTYVRREQLLAKKIVYNVLEPVLQILLLRQESAFLHASSISYGGDSVIFTGWGGAGKTSISSFLTKNTDESKFMSDDLTIISSSGVSYPYPKSCVVYPYNLDGKGVSVSDLTTGWLDRLQWEWRSHRYGGKQVRRRVPPNQIYGEEVASSSSNTISDVIYLSRENTGTISHEPISAKELANRCVPTIFDEFSSFLPYLNATSAADPSMKSMFELAREIKDIYMSCFERTDNTILRIPLEANPKSLSEYVVRNIIEASPNEKASVREVSDGKA